MRVGDAAEWLLQVAEETGWDIPILKERPEVTLETAFAWRTFAYLSRRRPAGFGGFGAIPLTEFEAWCRLNRVSHDEADELLEIVEGLDLEFVAEQRKAGEGS